MSFFLFGQREDDKCDGYQVVGVGTLRIAAAVVAVLVWVGAVADVESGWVASSS
jgi:hypothetical protein